MKKVFGLFLLAGVLAVLSGCGNNPIGPTPSMSISAASTSATAATTSVSSNNAGGASSVSSAQTGSVSTRSGDTNVSSVYVSTGVNSSVSGGSSASASGNSGASTFNNTTVRLSNHFISSGGPSGYFDFSAGIEVPSSGITSGDIGFRGTSNTNITFGSGMDFGGAGGLKMLGNTDINSVTSVTMDGFLGGLGNGVDTPESYFLGKCIAVSSQEGKIYIIQITGFDSKPNYPAWIDFKWKAL